MKAAILVLCFLALSAYAVEEKQFVLHPTVYQLTKMDTSLDNSPKCMTCRHIVTALRAHFADSTVTSSDSVIYEADPCELAPDNIKRWCSDIYKKLLQCPTFTSDIWDRGETAVKICESCSYDQFPLPSVRYCDNSLYQPLDDLDDQCNKCIDLVRHISTASDPCEHVDDDVCHEMQAHISHCYSFNKLIQEPFVPARRICEECAIPLDDGTAPAGFQNKMYCHRPVASPMLDNSMCSTCVNIVHNGRAFPTESPCRDMPDETCSYVQERLQQCTAFQRMKDQHMYSALSICEDCTDNKNPTTPMRFCAGQLRSGSPALSFDARNPSGTSGNNPGVFDHQSSPMLKPEPPAAPARMPWYSFPPRHKEGGEASA